MFLSPFDRGMARLLPSVILRFKELRLEERVCLSQTARLEFTDIHKLCILEFWASQARKDSLATAGKVNSWYRLISDGLVPYR